MPMQTSASEFLVYLICKVLVNFKNAQWWEGPCHLVTLGLGEL
jgi:hypothetical protein